jgi:hypothetical protein
LSPPRATEDERAERDEHFMHAGASFSAQIELSSHHHITTSTSCDHHVIAALIVLRRAPRPHRRGT